MKGKALTAREIQSLDRKAIEKYGVPSIVLMENAGRAVADEVLKDLRKIRRPKVCVFCGVGNNAGDGFVIARHLLNQGIGTKIFLIGRPKQLKADAAINYQILQNCKYKISEISLLAGAVRKTVEETDIIIDAIFGVGLNRDIVEPSKSIIEVLNHSMKRILAVDVPSGLNATTGKIYGVCIKAYKTVTFSFPKTGFFKNAGPLYIGKLVVADIGIPSKIK